MFPSFIGGVPGIIEVTLIDEDVAHSLSVGTLDVLGTIFVQLSSFGERTLQSIAGPITPRSVDGSGRFADFVVAPEVTKRCGVAGEDFSLRPNSQKALSGIE